MARAGYIFTAKVLRWVATAPEIVGWVRDAAGPTRDEIQWQKFEDTSTGYWLSYAPFTIDYANIGRWVHDMACHPNGEHKARGGGLYRPPINTTLLVHNLKNGGFHYTSYGMARGPEAYDHDKCKADLGSVSKARHRDMIEKRRREAKSGGGLTRTTLRMGAGRGQGRNGFGLGRGAPSVTEDEVFTSINPSAAAAAAAAAAVSGSIARCLIYLYMRS